MNGLLLPLIFTMLYSCSHSIQVRNPVNKHLSAESQGLPLRGKVLATVSSGTMAQVDLRNSNTDDPLILANEDDELLDVIVTGELGIWGPLDLIHISGGSLGSDMTGGKLQLIGGSKQESKKGNFSLALLGGYGKVVNNTEEGDDFELVATDEDTTSEMTISNQTYGALISYKLRDNTLLTLGHYIINHNFFGTLESENSALDGKIINYYGEATNTTLGIQVNMENILLSLEANNEKIKWDNTEEANVVYGSFAMGITW